MALCLTRRLGGAIVIDHNTTKDRLYVRVRTIQRDFCSLHFQGSINYKMMANASVTPDAIEYDETEINGRTLRIYPFYVKGPNRIQVIHNYDLRKEGSDLVLEEIIIQLKELDSKNVKLGIEAGQSFLIRRGELLKSPANGSEPE